MTPPASRMAVVTDVLARSLPLLTLLLLMPMSSTLNISSWNLNGIKGNILRREHLVSDAIRYHLDVVCLQETKCRDFEETIIDGHKLVTLAQSDNWYHYGLGFLICPVLVPSIVAWRSLSNRVAFIDLSLKERNVAL